MGIAFAAALAGSAGFSHSAPIPQPIVHKKTKRGLFNGRAYSSLDALIGRKSAGITCAQQKRASTKRRNQLRHKRVTRG